MNHRRVAAIAVAALLTASCGSRLDDSKLAAGRGDGGSGGGGGPVATQPAGEGGSADKFGTLDSPCGPAEGTVTTPAGVTGLTDKSITIGVISDKAGAVKVPTASVEESVKAFVGWCNERGGVNGRTLELKTYDAQLTSGDVAAKAACEDNLFALVGTGAVMDDKIAPVVVNCGLINVPAYTATAQMALSDHMVTPLPNPSNMFNTGPGRWIAKKFPAAVKKAGALATDLPTATVQMDRIQKAYEMIGYKYVYRTNTGIVMTSYSAEVADMKSKGVKYVSMVSATSETVKVLKNMKSAGFKPDVIDLGQQYYDTELLAEPGAEGAYVQTNTMPFEDVDSVPALQQFEAAYAKIDTKIEATSLGVQAFSAGLLFATAAKAAGSDLTRETLFENLKSIKEWDGGGLHFTSNPGDNAASQCFAYMQVKDGKFVRAFPTKPGEFACEGKEVVVDLKSDYGGGAKLPGS